MESNGDSAKEALKSSRRSEVHANATTMQQGPEDDRILKCIDCEETFSKAFNRHRLNFHEGTKNS